jgi:hypothetical protein
MKITFVIITLLSFGNIFSQDLNCLNFELYNSDYDTVQVENSSDSVSGISISELKSDSLQLIVMPNSYLEFPKWTSYKRNGIDNGFKIILINNSSNDFSLFNMDGKIIMKRQVFYKNEWKNVESFDKSRQPICGNSFFTKKVIESGDHFTFAAPCLEGNIETKFRFAIFTKPLNEQSAIYSNEFYGFINKKLIE